MDLELSFHVLFAIYIRIFIIINIHYSLFNLSQAITFSLGLGLTVHSTTKSSGLGMQLFRGAKIGIILEIEGLGRSCNS